MIQTSKSGRKYKHMFFNNSTNVFSVMNNCEILTKKEQTYCLQ